MNETSSNNADLQDENGARDRELASMLGECLDRRVQGEDIGFRDLVAESPALGSLLRNELETLAEIDAILDYRRMPSQFGDEKLEQDLRRKLHLRQANAGSSLISRRLVGAGQAGAEKSEQH